MSSSIPLKSWDSYQKLKVAGSGGNSSQVWLCSTTTVTNSNNNNNNNNKKKQQLVVVKRIFIENQEILKQAEQEIEIMQQQQQQKENYHENLIKLIDAFRDDENYINIVQEFAMCGDLDRVLSAKRKFFLGDDDDVNVNVNNNNNNAEEEKVKLLLAKKEEAQKLISVEEIAFLAAQILVALRHLHSQNILFRDVKPQNIVLDFWDEQQDNEQEEEFFQDSKNAENDGNNKNNNTVCLLSKKLSRMNENNKNSQQQQQIKIHPCSEDADPYSACTSCLAHLPLQCCLVKIIDFGVSKVISNTKSLASTVLGSPFYIPPELVESEPYNAKADMWSFGCVLYEIATCGHERLFDGDNMLALVRSITSGKVKKLLLSSSSVSIEKNEEEINYSSSHSRCSDNYYEKVNSMISDVVKMVPEERLSANEMLKKYFCLQ